MGHFVILYKNPFRARNDTLMFKSASAPASLALFAFFPCPDKNFFTYFPSISVSILTRSPTVLNPMVVIFAVWGIILTEKPLSQHWLMVRLIPSMATEPFSII